MKEEKPKKVNYRIKDEWYKYIIRNATEGFFITDTESHILDVNDAFCNMAESSEEEITAEIDEMTEKIEEEIKQKESRRRLHTYMSART
jgi:PAS domain S-box-containing protein